MPILAALTLIWCWAGAEAAEYPLAPTSGPGGPYAVVSDQPPLIDADNVARLPAGTTLTVKAPDRGAFVVDLIEPTTLGETSQRGQWSRRLVTLGGYKLQYGSEKAETLSSVHFIVIPGTNP